MKLPAPRLEFEWLKRGETWSKSECIYSLVLPLGEFDIRREDNEGNDVQDEHKLEISRTKIDSNMDRLPIDNGKVRTPFRDGAHADWDREALGDRLPIIAICGNTVTYIKEGIQGND